MSVDQNTVQYNMVLILFTAQTQTTLYQDVTVQWNEINNKIMYICHNAKTFSLEIVPYNCN